MLTEEEFEGLKEEKELTYQQVGSGRYEGITYRTVKVTFCHDNKWSTQEFNILDIFAVRVGERDFQFKLVV
jgi:hypothetical protein